MRDRFNGGQWTKSRFNSFIKGGLRTLSVRWAPRYETLAEAFVERKVNVKTGKLAKHFKCAKCGEDFPQKDVEVNHIDPVVPVEGFDSWDSVIERMFCEKEGLELLCKPCHKATTAEENQLRKKYK